MSCDEIALPPCRPDEICLPTAPAIHLPRRDLFFGDPPSADANADALPADALTPTSTPCLPPCRRRRLAANVNALPADVDALLPTSTPCCQRQRPACRRQRPAGRHQRPDAHVDADANPLRRHPAALLPRQFASLRFASDAAAALPLCGRFRLADRRRLASTTLHLHHCYSSHGRVDHHVIIL